MDAVPSQDQIEAAVLDHLPDPVVVLGPDARLLWANRRAEQRFGWSLDELQGIALDGLVHPDDLDTALLSLTSVADKDVGSLIDIRIQDRTGAYCWFEIRGSGWDDGPVPGSVIIDLRESTDRRKWELSAGDKEMLGAILDAAPTINLVLSADGTIRGASRALTRHLRRPLEGTLGTPLSDLVDPADREVVDAAVRTATGHSGTRTVEACLLTADGAPVPMSLTIVDLVSDQAVQGIVVAASDISALVEARSELHHLANHDGLTGLPNRIQLQDRLDRLLAHEADRGHTLVFGDVDGLKAVNDEYGHRAGDVVLADVAGRLARVIREDDFVARLSGDEFVVVVPTTDPTVVEDLQRRIAAVLTEPIILPAGQRVTVSMSLGVAITEPGVGAEELLAAADAAMYVAKRERPRQP